MRETLLLFKVLFKSSGSSTTGKSSNKTKLLYAGLCILLCVGLLPYGFIVYTQVVAGMVQMSLQLLMFCVLLVNLLQIFYQLPTTLYFSQDNRMLFPLPVSSGKIVLAQTMVISVSSLLIGAIGALLFVIPCLIAGECSALGLVLAVFAFLIAPLSELLIVGTLILVAMRFLPFFRNKDLFMLIFGVIGLVGGMLIAFSSMQAGQASAMDENMEALMLFSPELLSMGSNIFFQTNFAVDLVLGNRLFGLLCLLGSLLIPGALYFALAQKIYLPAAMSASASSSMKKKTKIRVDHDPLWKAFMKNDLRLLLRSPSFLLNCVLSSFIMPVVFTIAVVMDSSRQELIAELGGFDLMTIPHLWVWALFAGMALGLFSGGTNLTASTVITRGGRAGLNWMKVIPVPLTVQVRYKTILAAIIQYVASLLYLVLFHLLLDYPVWLDLVFAFGLFAAIVPFTQISVWVDVLMPKLDWTNETMAVKNNFTAVVEIFAGMFVAAAVIGLGVLLYEHIVVLAIILVVFFLALIPVFDWLIDRACRTKLGAYTRKSRKTVASTPMEK